MQSSCGGHPWTTRELEDRLQLLGFNRIEALSPSPSIMFVLGQRPDLPPQQESQGIQSNRFGGATLFPGGRRTEHFKRAQAGSGSGFDPELFEDLEDMFFHG